MNVLEYYKVDSRARDPEFATEGSACFDLTCCFDNTSSIWGYSLVNLEVGFRVKTDDDDRFFITLSPGDRVLVPSGLIFNIPEGYSVRVHPRSSSGLKKGLMLPNNEGVIDSDFFHETKILLWNFSDNDVRIFDGDRLVQAELVENVKTTLRETNILPVQTTDRSGGYGSTG